MLTKISLTTAAIMAVINVLVLLDVFELTTSQTAGINTAIIAVGSAIHGWFNPAVPFGK